MIFRAKYGRAVEASTRRSQTDLAPHRRESPGGAVLITRSSSTPETSYWFPHLSRLALHTIRSLSFPVYWPPSSRPRCFEPFMCSAPVPTGGDGPALIPRGRKRPPETCGCCPSLNPCEQHEGSPARFSEYLQLFRSFGKLMGRANISEDGSVGAEGV